MTAIRSFALALAVPLLAGAFLACGGDRPAASSTGSGTAALPGGPADADAPARAAELDRREEELRQRELDAREAELAAREAHLARREAALSGRPGAATRPAKTTVPAAPVATVAPQPTPAAPPPPIAADPAGSVEPVATSHHEVPLTVPAGTALQIAFDEGLSSASAAVGQRFRTRVVAAVLVDGRVAIPAGAFVTGAVSEVQSSARRVGGRARLGLRFDRLELPNGETATLAASLLSEGASQTKKDAATIGGAAAGGAILGRVLERDHKSKGTTVGAILGGAIGTAIAARNEGEEVTLGPGTLATLTLDDWVRVTVRE